MSKHQYLVRKCHWKSRQNFIELSADCVFSFLGIGSKTKTWNWRNVYCKLFYCKLHFPSFKQRSSKAALVHMSSSHFLGSAVVLKKEATTPIFHLKKKQKLNEKNVKKIFYCILTFILSF